MNAKETRNAQVLSMHNESKSIKEIADAFGMSKGGIHKILNAVLLKEPEATQTTEQKTEPLPVGKTETNKRFSSFVGWTRIDVNTYANKETAEVVKVKFIKAKNPNEFGYFVTT